MGTQVPVALLTRTLVVRAIRIGNRSFARKGIGHMRHSVAGLPFLLLIFPIPHLWLLIQVTPPADRWQFRDLGGVSLLLFDMVFVLVMLALLKISWMRLRFKWGGLVLLLAATTAMWQGSGKDIFTVVYLGGWLLLLVLSGLWLHGQRAYLD